MELGPDDNAKIKKINDKTIHVSCGNNLVKITLDENSKKLKLKKFNNAEEKIDVIIKNKNGNINIHKYTERQIDSKAEGFKDFFNIKPKDKVIVYDQNYHINALANVYGKYEFHDETFHYAHIKAVEWISDKKCNLNPIKGEIETNLSGRNTIIEMTEDDWDTIYAYAVGSKTFSSEIDIDVGFENETSQPTLNEPPYADSGKPERVSVITTRIIRDTKLVREIKQDFDWICQICGKRIILPNNQFYAEGHHIKPLGGDYNGLDIRGNIIILCPFHHAEFDYGSIAVDPKTKKIVNVDSNNEYHYRDLAYERSDLEGEFIEFHYIKIFGGSQD